MSRLISAGLAILLLLSLFAPLVLLPSARAILDRYRTLPSKPTYIYNVTLPAQVLDLHVAKVGSTMYAFIGHYTGVSTAAFVHYKDGYVYVLVGWSGGGFSIVNIETGEITHYASWSGFSGKAHLFVYSFSNGTLELVKEAVMPHYTSNGILVTKNFIYTQDTDMYSEHVNVFNRTSLQRIAVLGSQILLDVHEEDGYDLLLTGGSASGMKRHYIYKVSSSGVYRIFSSGVFTGALIVERGEPPGLFSGDGRYVFLGGEREVVILRRNAAGAYETLATIPTTSFSADVTSIYVKGNHLVATSEEGELEAFVVNLETGDWQRVARLPRDSVRSRLTPEYGQFFDETGFWFVIAGGNKLYLLDFLTGEVLQLFNIPYAIASGQSHGAWTDSNLTMLVGTRISSVSPPPQVVLYVMRISLGNALLEDPQSGLPRARFWGSYEFNRYGQDLSMPVALSAPQRDWHAYFFGGTVTVSRLFTETRSVALTKDADILQGRIGSLLDRGLVRGVATAEVAGYVDTSKMVLEKLSDPARNLDPEHTVVFNRMHVVQALYGWNGHGFSGSTVASAVVIDVPLSAPVSLYSKMVLNQSMSIVTIAPVLDWKNELIGVVGIPLVAGGASLAFAKYGAELAVENMIMWLRTNYQVLGLTFEQFTDIYLKIGGAAKLAGVLGAASTVVGIGLIADGLYSVYADYVTYSSVRTALIVAPVVEDTATGAKYSAVVFILPTEEIQGYASEYVQHISDLLSQEGVADVGVQFIAFGATWDEYRSLLEAGRLPSVDLKYAVESTVASKHGIDSSRLKVTGVKLIVETTVHGRTGLWQYLSGGIKVPVTTVVSGAEIQPRGVVAGGQVITDPAAIAGLLGSVSVNGVQYPLTPTAVGAAASFSFPLGAESLVVSFAGVEGFYGDVSIAGSVAVKKDFARLGDFGYEASLHYDWPDTLIRIDRIEFVDMEYPMRYAERTFVYAYGNFTHEITQAFYLNSTTDDPSSPSGHRYYYITVNGTRFIDPANGGIMQPCKTYVFRYYYGSPPDAELLLYLNGTQVTSTLARHATVVIRSTAEQDVGFSIVFRVKKLEGLSERLILEEAASGVLHVAANGTAYKTYSIEKYVDRAVQVMAEQGTTAFVEITARITQAPYNSVKENDEKTVVYYPPFSVSEQYGQPANLQVYAYDALTGSPIAGATVRVYSGAASYEQTTNSSGWTSFSVQVGLWSLEAGKAGYKTYSTQLYVHGDMAFNVPLVPEEAEAPPGVTPPVNGTPPNYPPVTYSNRTYWWLSVQVVWSDGFPFHGALVTVRNRTDNSVLFQQETNGTGFVYFLVPDGTPVRVEVDATNPLDSSQTFHSYKDLTMNQHYWLVFKLPWTSSYFEPEVMISGLQVVIHRGQGYFQGNVSHLVMLYLWTNYPQRVKVSVALLDASTNATISSKLLTLNLSEGVNAFMTWFDVNASRGMYVRAYADIVDFEVDTNLDNNEMLSGVVYLKPFLDLQVFVVWRPVRQKMATALLPEDVIEVDIGMYTPVNLTAVPASLRYVVRSYDLEGRRWNVTREAVERVRTTSAGFVWRNITLAVPWSNVITVFVNASHEWEDLGFNNAMNVTITVDPDVVLEKVEVGLLGLVREGAQYKIKFYIRSNVPEELGAKGFISVYDNTTQRLGGRIGIAIKPSGVYELTATAPENPKMANLISVPVTTHTLTAMFNGYDLYLGNNDKVFTITVYSLQLLWILAALIILILILAFVRALTHTAEYSREQYRFVRRRAKPGGGSLVHRTAAGEGEGERRFVRRKTRE